MTDPTSEIDAYLSGVRPDHRAALQALRETILDVLPGAAECMSYGMPAFRVGGKVACYFAAAKDHCALYPGGLVDEFAGELTGFSTSRGTIRFHPDRPIPGDLLRRIIARSAERATAPKRKR